MVLPERAQTDGKTTTEVDEGSNKGWRRKKQEDLEARGTPNQIREAGSLA